MSEFKVGDRVRIREDLKDDEGYHGTRVINAMLDYRGKIATIKWVQGVFYRIDLDEQTWIWTKEMFEGFGKEVISELIPNDRLEAKLEVKTKVEIKLEELEQRIEKLEKYASMGKYATDRKENVSNFEKMEQSTVEKRENEPKPSLLTEDERVILRNLDKKWKWIARDNNGFLSLFDGYEPFKGDYEWKSDGIGLFLVAFSHLFQFIKWTDNEPYNIEELLKGENKE